jgi:sucrose phosphorylase
LGLLRRDFKKKLSGYGCNIVPFRCFAYLHKQVGESNFSTNLVLRYLERIKRKIAQNELVLLPEIHAEIHLLTDEVAKMGYTIYDFSPGLTIHTIENRNSKLLLSWAKEIIARI